MWHNRTMRTIVLSGTHNRSLSEALDAESWIQLIFRGWEFVIKEPSDIV